MTQPSRMHRLVSCEKNVEDPFRQMERGFAGSRSGSEHAESSRDGSVGSCAAKEIALVWRSIIVFPPPGTAPIVRNCHAPNLPLTKPVPVAIENCTQIMIAKTLQHRRRIQRTTHHARAKRKMRDQHHGLNVVDVRKRSVQPLKRRLRNTGAENTSRFRRIKDHKLPAFVLETVIQRIRKYFFKRLPAIIRSVIVVANRREHRHP